MSLSEKDRALIEGTLGVALLSGTGETYLSLRYRDFAALLQAAREEASQGAGDKIAAGLSEAIQHAWGGDASAATVHHVRVTPSQGAVAVSPEAAKASSEKLNAFVSQAISSAADAVAASQGAGEPVASEMCGTCQGNGEIVTDWSRYLGPAQPGDQGDEGTAPCPDCDGVGEVAPPNPQARLAALEGAVNKAIRILSNGDVNEATRILDARDVLILASPRDPLAPKGASDHD